MLGNDLSPPPRGVAVYRDPALRRWINDSFARLVTDLPRNDTGARAVRRLEPIHQARFFRDDWPSALADRLEQGLVNVYDQAVSQATVADGTHAKRGNRCQRIEAGTAIRRWFAIINENLSKVLTDIQVDEARYQVDGPYMGHRRISPRHPGGGGEDTDQRRLDHTTPPYTGPPTGGGPPHGGGGPPPGGQSGPCSCTNAAGEYRVTGTITRIDCGGGGGCSQSFDVVVTRVSGACSFRNADGQIPDGDCLIQGASSISLSCLDNDLWQVLVHVSASCGQDAYAIKDQKTVGPVGEYSNQYAATCQADPQFGCSHPYSVSGVSVSEVAP